MAQTSGAHFSQILLNFTLGIQLKPGPGTSSHPHHPRRTGLLQPFSPQVILEAEATDVQPFGHSQDRDRDQKAKQPKLGRVRSALFLPRLSQPWAVSWSPMEVGGQSPDQARTRKEVKSHPPGLRLLPPAESAQLQEDQPHPQEMTKNMWGTGGVDSQVGGQIYSEIQENWRVTEEAGSHGRKGLSRRGPGWREPVEPWGLASPGRQRACVHRDSGSELREGEGEREKERKRETGVGSEQSQCPEAGEQGCRVLASKHEHQARCSRAGPEPARRSREAAGRAQGWAWPTYPPPRAH